MDKKVAFCKELNLDNLLPKIGEYSLEVLNKQVDTKYYIFRYINEKGFSWTALYDDEVEDYTVYIKTGLQVFNDISFIKPKGEIFWENLLNRYEESIKKTLVNPEESFVYAYRHKEIDNWKYQQVLPEKIAGFERTITPDKGIKGINGTYTIAEYKYPNEQTGIVICYNVYRDEFFAEKFKDAVAIVTHSLDAKDFPDLEKALTEELEKELVALK